MSVHASFPSGPAPATNPLIWMTAACMEPHFRRLTGWQGLAPCDTSPGAWTCRIKAQPGIYGIQPLSSSQADKVWRIHYFPAPDDPVIEQIAIRAAIVAASGGERGWIRDFPQHPDLAAAFAIAEMRVEGHSEALTLSLTADTTRRIIVPQGIQAPDGAWLVAPGGDEEHLPAFALANTIFQALAAGLSIVTGCPPCKAETRCHDSTLWQRDADGGLTPLAAIPNGQTTLSCTWAQAATTEPSSISACPLSHIVCGTLPPTPEQAAANRPQLIVVSGFLGSGKTSFLNQFIEFHAAHDQLVGVIQNELGDTGVDSHLLEGDSSVITLDAGCVCCSLAGSLPQGLRRLNETLAPEIIVLETTGLANPLNMRNDFTEIADCAELCAVVAVVDACNYDENLKATAIAADQITAADIVLLNKCDLISDADQTRITTDILRRNPVAQVLATVHGRIPPTLLEGISRHQAAPPTADTSTKCTCGCGGHGHHHHHHHHHGHHDHPHSHATHHDDGFSALRLRLPPQVDLDQLQTILNQTPANVYRIKGVVRCDDQRPIVVQYVAGTTAFEPAAKDDQTENFLLLIGQNLDPVELERQWLPMTGEIPSWN